LPLPDDAAVRAQVIALENRLGALDGQRTLMAGPPMDLSRVAKDQAEATGYLPIVAQAELQWGIAQMMARQTENAEKTFLEVVGKAAEAHHDTTEARAWIELVDVLKERSELAKALAYEAPARAALARSGGSLTYQAKLDSSLAWAERELGHLDEAKRRYQKAIEQLSAEKGHELQLGRAYNGLGVVYKEQAHYPWARDAYEKAIAIFSEAFGREHTSVANSLNNLGIALKYLGDREAAEQTLLRSRAMYVAMLGPEHPDSVLPLANLGVLYTEKGRYAEALETIETVRSTFEKAFGPHHVRVGYQCFELGRIHARMGHPEEALAMYKRAQEIIDGALGPENPQAAPPHGGKAESYLMLGQNGLAREESALALRMYQNGGKEPTVLASLELTRAEVLASSGREQAQARTLAQAAWNRIQPLGNGAQEEQRRADAFFKKYGGGPQSLAPTKTF
jgi:tetratricopeptide (TPR) repeat protein